ncbi:hypothetical protein OAC38_01370, partial [Candidatus Poseidoniaceae archaeon]|nr:hypothetical protein [Candidatus Poseidoniaceae archaeon]
MGLLDKASDAGTKPTAKKATPKAVSVAKAKPAKAVRAAKPVKAAKAAKEPKAARVRKPIMNNSGLPEGYEIATKNSRLLAWL